MSRIDPHDDGAQFDLQFDVYEVERKEGSIVLYLRQAWDHEIDAIEDAYTSHGYGEFVIVRGYQMLARVEVVDPSEERHIASLIEESGTDWARALAQCGPSMN